MNYEYIKRRQEDDLRIGNSRYYIYRHVSNPFTWLFIKLNLAPNTVTSISILSCLIGLYFLSKGSYLSISIGLLFLGLFHILDMSDGEVARITNKVTKIGLVLDRAGHYNYSVCFAAGIGLGFAKLYGGLYLVFGAILVCILLLESLVSDFKWE